MCIRNAGQSNLSRGPINWRLMSCYVKNVNGSYSTSTGERESRESRERGGLLEMGST